MTPTNDVAAYDVAIVGYGPVGATAANLLGQIGLNVVIIERDPDIYFRARAISTDEEVMRIWQQVGLSDRLCADMQPGAGANFVDADGVSIVKLQPIDRGNGHPPQQFIYQPAVDKALREGVDRFPNVSTLLEHECLRVIQHPDYVELMLADLTRDEFKRVRASYVIAADGGSSAIRGHLGIGFGGRCVTSRPFWSRVSTAPGAATPTMPVTRSACWTRKRRQGRQPVTSPARGMARWPRRRRQPAGRSQTRVKAAARIRVAARGGPSYLHQDIPARQQAARARLPRGAASASQR